VTSAILSVETIGPWNTMGASLATSLSNASPVTSLTFIFGLWSLTERLVGTQFIDATSLAAVKASLAGWSEVLIKEYHIPQAMDALQPPHHSIASSVLNR